MKRSPMPPRRTPLRSVGAKARREQDSIAAFRAAIRERSGGLCELDTPACPPGPHEGHHAHHLSIADRDRGVHDPERGAMACAQGHDFVHAHPAVSFERGWLLRDVTCRDCWVAPTVAVEPHPTLERTNVVTKCCETCGRRRRLHSAVPGRGYCGDGSDPDRGMDRHLSGREWSGRE